MTDRKYNRRHYITYVLKKHGIRADHRTRTIYPDGRSHKHINTLCQEFNYIIQTQLL